MSLPIGEPLPVDSNHACSVSLPSWASVVGYEEGTPEVVHAMKCGYPRFVYHPYVRQLMELSLKLHGSGKNGCDEDCLVLPSASAAKSCHDYLVKALYSSNTNADWLFCHDNAFMNSSHIEDKSKGPIRVVDLKSSTNVHAVFFPAETNASLQAKSFWQHTGEVVSSRRAEQTLLELETSPNTIIDNPNETTAEGNIDDLKVYLSQLALNSDSQGDNVTLYPSGMSSIYHALRSARRCSSAEGKAIVFGFPYLDTLKLCSRREIVPGGVEFLGYGDASDLLSLKQLLKSGQKVSAVLTEVPSNPLCKCPDVIELRKLADQYGFALIVDDTIGNFGNIDLLSNGIADAVCTSLTKLVSGRGDVMGGSIITNPNTATGRWMQQDLASSGVMDLYETDIQVLLANSRDFQKRNQRINQTSLELVDWLSTQEGISKLYFPNNLEENQHIYNDVLSRNPGNSFGGLFSIILSDHICPRTFYDTLNIAKGPSLGTNFSLMCPYTLLAHYHELEFAMTYNVQPHLIRISIGLEDRSDLQNLFQEALERSKLHLKLPTMTHQQTRSYHRTTKRNNMGIDNNFPPLSYAATAGASTLVSCLVRKRISSSSFSLLRL